MKIKASILSLCLLLYMAELVALPVSIGSVPAKRTRCNTKMMCGRRQPPCKKTGKDCNESGCCINCPLCYVVTIPRVTNAEKPVRTDKKEYSSFTSNYSFLYSASAWKPPNGC